MQWKLIKENPNATIEEHKCDKYFVHILKEKDGRLYSEKRLIPFSDTIDWMVIVDLLDCLETTKLTVHQQDRVMDIAVGSNMVKQLIDRIKENNNMIFEDVLDYLEKQKEK